MDIHFFQSIFTVVGSDSEVGKRLMSSKGWESFTAMTRREMSCISGQREGLKMRLGAWG